MHGKPYDRLFDAPLLNGESAAALACGASKKLSRSSPTGIRLFQETSLAVICIVSFPGHTSAALGGSFGLS